MKIGFTGTRKGLTETQNAGLFIIVQKLKKEKIEGIRHGGCKGGDTSFHLMISHRLTDKIFIHPGDIYQFDFWNQQEGNWKVFEPRPYLERNKTIVDDSDLILVCPDGYKEKIRSGTWSTYRYAKRKRKKIIIIYPDGSVKHE